MEAMLGQEGPHDLVEGCAAHYATVREQHEVPDGLAVELEQLEDLPEVLRGIIIAASLDVHPPISEGLVEGLLVMPLKPLKVRNCEVPHPLERHPTRSLRSTFFFELPLMDRFLRLLDARVPPLDLRPVRISPHMCGIGT